MFVGVLQVTLSIPGAHSLKKKRRVVKSLLERLRNRHAVSASEVDHLDTWNRAGVGIAFVSGDRRHADSHLAKLLEGLHREREVLVLDSQLEVF